MNLNPISQLDPVVIVLAATIFLLTFAGLRRFFVLPYVEVMEARDRLCEDAEACVSEAAAVARSADLEAEGILRDAAQTAEQVRTEALTEVEEYRRATVDAAQKKAAAHLESGRTQIAALRSAQLAAVHDQAVECVGLACDQLLGDGEDTAVPTTVDRVMNEHYH